MYLPQLSQKLQPFQHSCPPITDVLMTNFMQLVCCIFLESIFHAHFSLFWLSWPMSSIQEGAGGCLIPAPAADTCHGNAEHVGAKDTSFRCCPGGQTLRYRNVLHPIRKTCDLFSLPLRVLPNHPDTKTPECLFLRDLVMIFLIQDIFIGHTLYATM